MTMQPDPQQPAFLLPVSYWPARTASHWWDDFRGEEVVKDFNLASAAGARLLCLSIPWEAAQPYSDRVSLTFMRDLEHALRVASDTGIQCLLSIAVASVFETPTLPAWFYELTADAHARPLRVIRRLYEDPIVVRATARLIGEVTQEFGQHPGVSGWILGSGLMSASPALSVENTVRWLESMDSSAHDVGKRRWHGISARDLVYQRSLQPRVLGRSGFAALLSVDWKPPWAGGTRVWTDFLVWYIRGLGGLPPLVAGTARHLALDHRTAEDGVHQTIENLRVAGAAGLVWPALLDYDAQLRTRPPFTSSPGELMNGLLPSTGSLSPAAIAWLDEMQHPGQAAPAITPFLDEELRERDPEAYARDAYLEFIA